MSKKHPDLETELASAAILKLRRKNGIPTSQEIGKKEENAARDIARKILEAIDLNIMNQNKSTVVDNAQRESIIGRHRNASVIVDLSALLEDIHTTASNNRIADISNNQADAGKAGHAQVKRSIAGIQL
jgi:hypothetical protein